VLTRDDYLIGKAQVTLSVTLTRAIRPKRNVTRSSRAAVLDDKKGVSKQNPYTLSFLGRVKALTIRQFRSRTSSGFTSFGFAASLALVVGAADLNYRWPLLAVSPEERRLQSYLGCPYDNGTLYVKRTSKLFQQTISHVQPYRLPDCQLALRPAILRRSHLRLQHHRLLHDWSSSSSRSLLDILPHQLHQLSLYARFLRTFGLRFQRLNTAFRASVTFVPDIVNDLWRKNFPVVVS
jgi:ATP-binding cassette subfamily G (WHITE) protein 2 (SNQ2)